MQTPRIAFFPGSFDPVTNGHLELIERCLRIVDQLIIGIGQNSAKTPLYPLALRLEWLRQLTAAYPQVSIISFAGLTVTEAQANGAQFLLRGLRRNLDFEYEQTLEHLNKHLVPELETIYLISSPQTAFISSTLVREIIRNGGQVAGLVPDIILEQLQQTPI
jgi:pantetheine-phosphate adenylyltransferase